jgi:predicted transport protein
MLDPKGLCKDVSGLGRWGNGDVEVGISTINELDDVMELIQQTFDKQLEYL